MTMKQLTEVSETALITLRSRVVESRKTNPLLHDPVGEELFNKLTESLPDDARKRVMERKISPLLTSHIAMRARKYDLLCREFLQEYPDGLIVSLGAGFDTRFWRLGGKELKYMELDLPAVIQAKKQHLGEKITYNLMAESVLDERWIQELMKIQSEHLMFVAEGLFMYLPKEQVILTLARMADSFSGSRIVMEVIAEKYTRGFRKKMVKRKMRKGAGSTAGDYYQFGIKEAAEVESYHSAIKVSGEWSYFEDPDVKPAILKLFRHSKALSKTQYSVMADIN
jgi:methyltransferase (TIGR00027 family)